MSTWSDADKASLQRTIDPLKNCFRFQPFGFLKSEATTMLCAPSSEVYDRLTLMLTNISVVSGLVLSSIAGVALSPLDVASFAGEKQVLAEAYNVMAALAVITQFMVCPARTRPRRRRNRNRPLTLPLTTPQSQPPAHARPLNIHAGVPVLSLHAVHCHLGRAQPHGCLPRGAAHTNE